MACRKPSRPGPRYQALLQVLRTAEALWESSRVLFSRWELSPSQFNVLNLLGESADGMTQVDLSRALIMHRSNVTGLVDRLERRKLVRRTPLPSDRRAHRVVLTPSGRSLLEAILPEYHTAAESIWGDVPAHKAGTLASTLEKLSANAARTVSPAPSES